MNAYNYNNHNVNTFKIISFMKYANSVGQSQCKRTDMSSSDVETDGACPTIPQVTRLDQYQKHEVLQTELISTSSLQEDSGLQSMSMEQSMDETDCACHSLSTESFKPACAIIYEKEPFVNAREIKYVELQEFESGISSMQSEISITHEERSNVCAKPDTAEPENTEPEMVDIGRNVNYSTTFSHFVQDEEGDK